MEEKKFSPGRFWGKTILGFICVLAVAGLVLSTLYLGEKETARQVSFASVVFSLAISAGVITGIVRFFKKSSKEESDAEAKR